MTVVYEPNSPRMRRYSLQGQSRNTRAWYFIESHRFLWTAKLSAWILRETDRKYRVIDTKA